MLYKYLYLLYNENKIFWLKTYTLNIIIIFLVQRLYTLKSWHFSFWMFIDHSHGFSLYLFISFVHFSAGSYIHLFPLFNPQLYLPNTLWTIHIPPKVIIFVLLFCDLFFSDSIRLIVILLYFSLFLVLYSD